MRSPRARVHGLVVMGAGLLLASCQAVFTFSPFKFLQRDPANLTPDQQVEFAQAALTSGDDAAVKAAYDVISAAAEANQDDPELQYMAAQLALEVAGVGDLLQQVLTEGTDFTIDESIWTGITPEDIALIGDAGEYLQTADDLNADLTSTDYLVGAVGLMIAGAEEGADPVATASDNENTDEAIAFLEQGIAGLPEGDGAADILQQFLDSLNGL